MIEQNEEQKESVELKSTIAVDKTKMQLNKGFKQLINFSLFITGLVLLIKFIPIGWLILIIIIFLLTLWFCIFTGLTTTAYNFNWRTRGGKGG